MFNKGLPEKEDLKFPFKSSQQSPPQKKTDQKLYIKSLQQYVDCLGIVGKKSFNSLLKPLLSNSFITKLRPPKEEIGELFSTFISVLLDNTNLGESTTAGKPYLIKFSSIFINRHADLRFQRRGAQRRGWLINFHTILKSAINPDPRSKSDLLYVPRPG